MKKYLLFLLPLSLLSSEINFTKTFKSEVASDMISDNIIIKTSRDNSDDIITIFEKYNDLFKTSELIYTKQKEQITPNYNTNIYSGNLSYNIKSYSFEKINDFIKELLYLKDEKNLTISIEEPKYILSNKLQEEITHKLRVKAINFSKTYVNKLSNDLNKQCELKDVKIQDVKTTIQNTNIIDLKVDYKMECQ
jgi:hypothetical protein